MCPCSPNDVSIALPDVPSGPAIPGFGIPFALKIPDISPFPDGFPEDLLELFDRFQFLIPSGIIKPTLNPNFSKDIFDSIMSMLDQFFPFLMLYKFFLPLLNLIICMIEVLCAIPNPFKLIRAMRRLFRRCIPAFLNLFPIFAMIVMIISLLLLLLALIEYIISQILKFVEAILRNINALVKSFQDNDQNSVLAIAKKLGSLLCIFQNLFVLLALFNTIIQVIKDVLSLSFRIPPCKKSRGNDPDDCCTPDVCPAIVQTSYVRNTGNLNYISQGIFRQIGTGFSFDTVDRVEAWQIFDTQQLQEQEFINIVDPFDVTNVTPKPVFFPMDSTYNSQTAASQAAYTIDLRLFYNPTSWGRTGTPRYIQFKDCIVTKVPTRTVIDPDNDTQSINSGVLLLAGGLGYEDDSSTILTGFGSNGITPIANQATLENFLHKPPVIGINTSPIYTSPTDGYVFSDISYIFKPILETLLSKNLITIGCDPELAADRDFIDSIFSGDIGVKTALVNNLINSASFPDTNATQECLSTALAALRNNLTPAGVAQFQATAILCLNKLRDDANNSLTSLIGIGFDPCKSGFSLNPSTQFTSKTIKVSVNLKDNNGISITSGLSSVVADNLANRIKGHITFGEITRFVYDGYSLFNAEISSREPGNGTIMISFDNSTFCTNNIPEDINASATHDLQVLDYSFIYTPTSAFSTAGNVGNIVTDGQPRRDESDLAREGDNTTKGGS